MSTRFDKIDIIRGLFFIPMFIYHLFSFYDLTSLFKTNWADIPIIKNLGYVRNLYIILAGFSVYLSYKSYQAKKEKNKDIQSSDFFKTRLYRTLGVAKYALIISIISHYLFPTYGIKFGILHFIALGTLFISPIVFFLYKFNL